MTSHVVRRAVRWALVAGVVALLPAAAQAQNPVTITGRITGESGEVLRAASITIPALNITVYASSEGVYRIVVPGARAASQQVVLTARQLGYRAEGVTVRLAPGATLEQNFRLMLDPLRLDEVVVTGAGTEQLAERMGTARATVSGQALQRANETNVVQALAGKSPGVLTNAQGGDAGSSTAIQIRGAKTFGASQPVFIVDGVPINNATRPTTGSALSGAPVQNRAADINPEDIESIEILKGAAATSIYGAAAGSAGAILITTKRGKAGRTQYTLRSTFQADEPVRTVPMQRTYGVGTGGQDRNCTTVNCSLTAFFAWGAPIPAGVPTYDHAAEIYETGQIFENSLSMSGGSERTTFYLSAGSLDHDGFVTGDRDFLKRYSVRLNGSHSVFDNLTVGASASYIQTRTGGVDRGNAVNGLTLNAQRQPPEFNAKMYRDSVNGLHRSWRFPNPGANSAVGTGGFSRGFDNPFYAINEHDLLAESGRILGNVNANYRPFSWLVANWTLGTDYTSDDRTNAFGQAASGQAGGSINRWQFYDRIIDHSLSLTASRDFSDNFKSSLTVGQNLNETYFRQIDVSAQTWIAARPYKLSNTVTRSVPSDAESRRRVEGYFVQAEADMFDQLTVQGRLRSDGNSAFGVENQRATYPGGQIAWRFTKALNLSERLLSFGKLRAAYGESGQQPPLYATQDLFTAAAFSDFNPGSLQVPNLNGLGGLYASAGRGNPNIEPERVKELEYGFDIAVLSGRADLSVTRYDSESEGVILGVPTPPSTGYTSQTLNVGGITNKGWEVTSAFRPISNSNVTFEINGNWGRNRNLVTSLGALDVQRDGMILMPTAENCGPEASLPRCQTGFGSSFSGQSTHAQIGYPIGTWRGTDFARCGRGLTTVVSGGTTHNVGAACEGAAEGALYIGPNGFPIGDPTQRAIGNPWPDWTGGLGADLRIRRLQISAFLDHRQGGNVLNMTRSSMYQYGTHKDTEIRGQSRTFGKDMQCHNITCEVLNGPVVGPGAGTAVVLGETTWFNTAQGGNTAGPITTRIEDATNTRLREISIGYSFTGPWVQNFGGIRALDLKLSGRNLKLWTDYSGLDPEVNLGGAANANRGIDWFNTPYSRAWVMSVTLNR